MFGITEGSEGFHLTVIWLNMWMFCDTALREQVFPGLLTR